MPTDQVGVPDSAGDRGAAASWRSERSPETDPVVGDSATSVVSLSVQEAGVRARAAAREMAVATTAQKNRALRLIADALETESESLLAANAKDVRRAEEAGRPESLVDRLRLDQGRLRGIAEAVRQVAELADPVGEVVRGSIRPNGLQVREQRVPFGVVGMIFEARPNVTVDAAALCLKSGNAVVLRGSSHAVESNRALVGVMRAALERTDIPADAVRLLDGDRDEAAFLMKARGLVDVIVPRGGAELIRTVVEESSVPVIETGSGNVHLYVDAAADLTKALDILMNAKTQRPSVCNAVETLLVHEKVAEALLDAALPALHAAGVVVHGDRVVRELASRVGAPVEEVTHEDWACEYHGLEIAVGVVDSLDTAMKHVARYSTGHTEAIVTEDRGAARRWTQGVDAAVVMVNASTRFTDGGEFGFGAEIGISTQKMHARGPMGLRELTSTKWIVEGDGQIRD
ncbi:glutamate-5-semialdehyde dehydrogenase [Austwickia chelonae]